jgi:hypothetical protein
MVEIGRGDPSKRALGAEQGCQSNGDCGEGKI